LKAESQKGKAESRKPKEKSQKRKAESRKGKAERELCLTLFLFCHGSVGTTEAISLITSKTSI
jgi:hypothetical protein